MTYLHVTYRVDSEAGLPTAEQRHPSKDESRETGPGMPF